MLNLDSFAVTNKTNLTVDEACLFIETLVTPTTCINKVDIRSALGRYLAKDIYSNINVPSHTNSAMDGYAINGDDIPAQAEAQFDISCTVFAGQPFSGTVGKGQCARIMTGGMIPTGTDTVIMQEEVENKDDKIVIQSCHRKGQNVRQAGEDLAIGQIALHKGQKIMPSELGILASLGLSEVKVLRRLRVAFFSTGDELRSIGEPLGEGDVYDSNRYSLYGMLTRLDVDIIDMGVIADSLDDVEAAFTAAAENADVVITSGGVSVGDADYVKEALTRLGEVKFWKIAMKPGRPLAFGKIKDAIFFGLPGNPVAVMVTFYQFVQNALLTIAGAEIKPRLQMRIPTTTAFKKAPGRTTFIRGVISNDKNGKMSVCSTGQQGSGILHSMSQANCFIILTHDQGMVAEGDIVTVEPFAGFI
ncbi:MAG: molybdopterin molybdotransferase MoeA [Woeseiaceae bacterium]